MILSYKNEEKQGNLVHTRLTALFPGLPGWAKAT